MSAVPPLGNKTSVNYKMNYFEHECLTADKVLRVPSNQNRVSITLLFVLTFKFDFRTRPIGLPYIIGS